MLDIISRISIPIDKCDDAQRLVLIEILIRNQFVIRWADLMCCSRPSAQSTSSTVSGEINDSRILSGVMVNNDMAHPQMHRRIHKPCIVLLSFPLEYRDDESRPVLKY